jgi:hypothetical protein
MRSNVHIRQYLGFNSRDVRYSSYLIFQTQAVGNYELIDAYVSRQGRLYLHCVGRGW